MHNNLDRKTHRCLREINTYLVVPIMLTTANVIKKIEATNVINCNSNFTVKTN